MTGIEFARKLITAYLFMQEGNTYKKASAREAGRFWWNTLPERYEQLLKKNMGRKTGISNLRSTRWNCLTITPHFTEKFHMYRSSWWYYVAVQYNALLKESYERDTHTG